MGARAAAGWAVAATAVASVVARAAAGWAVATEKEEPGAARVDWVVARMVRREAATKGTAVATAATAVAATVAAEKEEPGAATAAAGWAAVAVEDAVL